MSKVLYVEDNDDNVYMLKMRLELLGDFEVLTAEDGEKGCEKAVSERPDIILMDLQMPVLDGVELIKLIRGKNEYADLPLLAMTGHGNQIRQLATEAGANKAMDKPISESEMREAIASVLSSEGK